MEGTSLHIILSTCIHMIILISKARYIFFDCNILHKVLNILNEDNFSNICFRTASKYRYIFLCIIYCSIYICIKNYMQRKASNIHFGTDARKLKSLCIILSRAHAKFQQSTNCNYLYKRVHREDFGCNFRCRFSSIPITCKEFS